MTGDALAGRDHVHVTLAPPNPLPLESDKRKGTRKIGIRLPGKGDSDSHSARLVH